MGPGVRHIVCISSFCVYPLFISTTFTNVDVYMSSVKKKISNALEDSRSTILLANTSHPSMSYRRIRN